jgi:hydrogenase maturation protein HypF
MAPDIRSERWIVRGVVQGVGFRPFIYRVANELGLKGWVQNTSAGVTLELAGPDPALDRLQTALLTQLPPLARIDTLERTRIVGLTCDDFAIRPSIGGEARAGIAADTATCVDCLRELRNPDDRRHRHPLINCTNCGPRYTIIRRVPYDRAHTSMAPFDMCDACAREYADPGDRRYHAQPVCCPHCGPRVRAVTPDGHELPGEPLRNAAESLAAGAIVAIKGLGGYHLAVRGDDDAAVRRLRRRKRREAKPFALMVANPALAERLAVFSPHGLAALVSGVRPIVLAPRRAPAPVADAVAPASARLGIMLPYTPIQALLLDDPALADLPVVMTSANFSNEPLVIADDDAYARLSPICDLFVVHERPIERPVDDSVVLDVPGAAPVPIRRARGIVPAALRLPPSLTECSDGLAVGGDLKSTLAIVRRGEAILSQHLGDLEDARTFDAYTQAANDLLSLFEVRPSWIAHDAHPDYFSTRFAMDLAARLGCPLISVQHHHAHAAALLAEHGRDERFLAIVCDGTGFGTDGTIWGGEVLACDFGGFERLMRLRPIALAGGDAAARDVRRSALAVLLDACGTTAQSGPIAAQLIPDDRERHLLARMIATGTNAPRSSGVGRLFDAVAALLGIADANHFEGQAAQALESLADQCEQPVTARPPAFELRPSDDHPALLELDWRLFVRWLVDAAGDPRERPALARAFHDALAAGLTAAIQAIGSRVGLRQVGLSGGVFCNARLTQAIATQLRQHDYAVLTHQRVPPNDGGLALGQAAVAAARARQ